jgi:hypothetical protein
MRITIRPAANPERELDVTHALIAAVAHQLWEHGAGNHVVNWLEAERFVARLAAGMHADTHPPRARPRRAEGARRKTRRSENEVFTGPLPNF